MLLERGQPARSYPHVKLADLLPLVMQISPGAVAVDSPPGWSLAGRSRAAERQLARLGIHSYAVPVDPGEHPFYSWMRTGFEVFSRLKSAYPLYLQGPSVFGYCVEVFPHASAVVLSGSLQPPTWTKLQWRRSVLTDHGVLGTGLHSIDLIDAALAALTGLEALDGNYCAIGDPQEGVIVVPARCVPNERYHAAGIAGTPGLSPGATDDGGQEMNRCGCGCGALVRRRYLPGHDAKHRSRLLRAVKGGHAQAVVELQARGWMPPAP